jgi:hypothetical protein
VLRGYRRVVVWVWVIGRHEDELVGGAGVIVGGVVIW